MEQAAIDRVIANGVIVAAAGLIQAAAALAGGPVAHRSWDDPGALGQRRGPRPTPGPSANAGGLGIPGWGATLCSMTRVFRVPLGAGEVAFALPEGMRGTSVTARPAEPLPDLDAAVRDALARPVAGPRLHELAAGARSACVVVTDVTRACPEDRLLPPLLAELAAGGIADGAVTILVAAGLHRPMTAAEKSAGFGEAVVARYRVVDHDAFEPAGLVDLGAVAHGVPAVVNRIAVEADLLVATGIVEPHQFAGLSGGRKTVALGVADEATIGATHGVAMIDHPGTRLASLDGNPSTRRRPRSPSEPASASSSTSSPTKMAGR
ncbi:MAG: hypothetical protein A2X23_01960 [Chloroflexi bacterium GWC2_73_18]|nr:MAG: hypothetical protein A2X23_01960 [Chloroflexi bacterium GWC2_73_18]